MLMAEPVASVGLIPVLMASMGLRFRLVASHFPLELASFRLLLYREVFVAL